MEINNNVDIIEKVSTNFCKENHFSCSKISTNKLNSVRCKILNKIKEDKELSKKISKKEIDLLMNNEHLLARYMLRKRRDENEQIDFIINALIWRSSIGLAELNKDFFPIEAWKNYVAFPFKKTKTGEIIFYVRFCIFLNVNLEILDLLSLIQLDLLTHLSIKHNTNWVWFYDLSNASRNNIDIRKAKFMINTLRNYFPSVNNKIIVYNLPWYLSFFKTIFNSFTPASVNKITSFYNSKNINELIDEENLPPFLGGSTKYEDCPVYKEFISTDKNLTLNKWKESKDVLKYFKNKNTDFKEVIQKLEEYKKKVDDTKENLTKKGIKF